MQAALNKGCPDVASAELTLPLSSIKIDTVTLLVPLKWAANLESGFGNEIA